MKALVGVLIPIAVVFGFAYWLFLPRPSDAPPPPSLTGLAPPTVDADDLDGRWELTDGWVGYRIDERIVQLYGRWTAVARTSEVDGALEVAGTTVESATVTADLSALESESRRRDRNLQLRYLESEEFPHAQFALTEPFAPMGLPVDGQTLHVSVAGELTVRETRRPVVAELEAALDGHAIAVVGHVPVELAEFFVEPPQIPGFRFVEDRGLAEMDLRFERAG